MKGFSLGNWLGIPVWVDPGALFVLAYLVVRDGAGGAGGLAGGVILAGGILLSILVHELGHAVTANWMRLQPIGIVIHGFGGYTQYRVSPTPMRGLPVTFAGPFAQLVLGVVLWFLPLDVPQVRTLAEFNIFWAIFNLLPIFPMDGGRILAYMLGLAVPLDSAYVWAARIAIPLWLALGVYCLVNVQIFALIVVGSSLAQVVPLALGTRRAG